MNLSGEFRIQSTPDKIRQQFQDPKLLEKVVPNCHSMVELETNLFLATMDRLTNRDQQIQYHFRFSRGENNNQFVLSFKGVEPEALVLSGRHIIYLKPDQGATILTYHSTIELSKMGRESAVDPSKIFSKASEIFDNVADTLQPKDKAMTKTDSKLDDAINKTENAVVELELEAEEAAATGFLGGAQMWGWIAVAILALVLLVFFR
ncbi:SRPBCC domain-containing protein [Cohaesibacter celericrescens]|uniref:SRPBCC domain-containing protein n=1 Tax=Cohaesibacter celericrescens TaxID=2067669 RepID=UPI00356169C7